MTPPDTATSRNEADPKPKGWPSWTRERTLEVTYCGHAPGLRHWEGPRIKCNVCGSDCGGLGVR